MMASNSSSNRAVDASQCSNQHAVHSSGDAECADLPVRLESSTTHGDDELSSVEDKPTVISTAMNKEQEKTDRCSPSNSRDPAHSTPESNKSNNFRKPFRPQVESTDSSCSEESEKTSFKWYDFLLAIAGMVLCVFDVFSDIRLAVLYFLEGHVIYGAVTLTLVVLAYIVSVKMAMYHYELCTPSDDADDLLKASWIVWCCRIALTLLMLGPVVRSVEYVYNGCKSRECSENLTKQEEFEDQITLEEFEGQIKKEELEDQITLEEFEGQIKKEEFEGQIKKEELEDQITLVEFGCQNTQEEFEGKMKKHQWMNNQLAIFEACIEAAPQLVFQLYVLLVTKPQLEGVDGLLRVLTLLSSWFSLALALTTYKKTYRNYFGEGPTPHTLRHQVIDLLWRLPETGGRILCIACFASVFRFYVLAVVIPHLLLFVVWQYYRMKGTIGFDFVYASAFLFAFFKMFVSNVRLQTIAFYLLFYIENFTMLLLWYFYTPDQGAWFHTPILLAGFLSLPFHVLLQVLYYLGCHPKWISIETGIPCGWKHWKTALCDRSPDYKKKPNADSDKDNDPDDVEWDDELSEEPRTDS